DAGRDRVVIGEGSGAFVVEDRDHAAARGARALARVLGFGISFEPATRGQWSTGHAIRNSIELSLREAHVSPEAVGHVNANGKSAVIEDAVEAQAIRRVLGDVPVTAPKSYFGSLGAGTGAVEMAATLIAFEHRAVPATLNFETPDPACPVNVVHGQALPAAGQLAVVLNQSSTGQAAAVVLAAS
ncbi:MAG: beta-ketoacyl-[acyl-carrier-protein] synthase family protein, partial [Pirellulaceae bacterium]